MGNIGVIEKIYNRFTSKIEDGEVNLDSIISFILDFQKHQFDSHIAISGQNGIGKTMLMLAIMKKLNEDSIKHGNILYAFNTHRDFIQKLAELRDTALGIDELNVFFNYKQGMTTEQIALFNMIEIAREHRVAIIGCVRDVRRLNNNYRDGKLQLVIWVLDRYDHGKTKTYGLVFIGNPVLEEQDKFMLNQLAGIDSMEDMRLVVENIPTFCGYLFFDDVEDYVTKEELKEYKDKKEEGIQKVYKKWMEKLDEKENSVLPKVSKDNIEADIGTIPSKEKYRVRVKYPLSN